MFSTISLSNLLTTAYSHTSSITIHLLLFGSYDMRMMKYLLHLLVFCLVGMDVAFSQSMVDTLPGYDGSLPFKLETGYIGVGNNKEMFYYFIQSENDPATDPLLLWLPGGAGCSALSSLLYENGPLTFDIANFDGSNLPSLALNPYSWTKVASIIFLDTPVGAGFSYFNSSSQPSASSDSKTTLDNYTFLRKWFSIHPTFLKNRLYIAGESFGGKMTPLLALEIAKGNEAGLLPKMPLKGYIIGNPGTPTSLDMNIRVAYAHRVALISDQHFEQAQRSCNGELGVVDPSNIQCLHALELIKECTDGINMKHILEPICPFTSSKSSDSGLLLDHPVNLLTLSNAKKITCRDETYIISEIWANDESVRESLHTRKDTINDWSRCKDIPFESDVEDVVEYHQLLGERGFQALVYSGDHDMNVPYMDTFKWIHQLNVTVNEIWRPWTVDGQVAGYSEKYKHNQAQAYIAFATVKGAGHTAPEYKPKECFAMIQRWLSLDPL